jgi:hypothetical protein
MKTGKRIAVILLPLLIVLLYVLFSRGVFSGSGSDGEVKLVSMTVPRETGNLTYYIDSVSTKKSNGKDALFIRGWVINNRVQSKDKDVFLVLKFKGGSKVFEINNDTISRSDVSEGLNLVGGIHGHGFEIYVPLSILTDSIYQIGFVLWDPTGRYYVQSPNEIRIQDGTVKAGFAKFTINSTPESYPVSLCLKAPTINMKFAFDELNVANNKLLVRGWGFLDGQDSDSLETFLLLKKNQTILVFSLGMQTRKDVTDANKELKKNLDASGFGAEISTDKFEKGRYQVGLYIMKGNQTGMVTTDRFVTI